MKRVQCILIPLLLAFSLYAQSQSYNLEIVEGGEYSHRHWFGIFPVMLTPQIAVWLEDSEGRFIRTIYITEASAMDSWKGIAHRPEALPVYFHAKIDGEDVDAVTGASDKSGGRERVVSLPSDEKSYVIMAEVNSSFAYNDSYTEGNSGVNGQPSVIYAAQWTEKKPTVTLRPVGRGSVTGEDGEIREDLENLTTALERIESITISY